MPAKPRYIAVQLAATRRNTYHRDGSITYWSVYRQLWIRRARADEIPRRELAAMSDAERRRIFAAHRAADPHCTCNDCIEYLQRTTEHEHTCHACGHVWSCVESEERCDEQCPTCGNTDQRAG